MKKKSCFLSKTIFIFIVLAHLLGINFSLAQQEKEKIVIGEIVTIKSKILNEERRLWIYRPVGYNQSQEKYPVLYMLDAQIGFYYASSFLRSLHRFGRMPAMILVGILNTDRNRDFTPTRVSNPTEGGADMFIKFMKDDLIPFMDQNYRTQPFRILCGVSLTGMFTVYTFLTSPDVFSAYIASSPSLWWDKRLLVKNAEILFKKDPKYKSNKFLFIVVGHRDDTNARDTDHILSSTDSFCKILEHKAPKELEWHFDIYKKGDHLTTPMQSLAIVLETLYSNWQLPKKVMDTGIQAVQIYFELLSEKYGYEIPVPESAYNRMGYNLMNQQKLEEAIEIFKLNVKLYPDSWNVYDSLGEAYMKIGDRELAIKNLKKSIELNPQNDNAIGMLNKLREK
jgi:predicted alpha/beta superfamily hydrolase